MPSCVAAASNDVEPVLYAPKLKTTSRSLTGPLYSNESKSCVLLPCTTCWQTSTKCFGSIFPAALSRSFPAKRSAASASRCAFIFSCSALRAATRSALSPPSAQRPPPRAAPSSSRALPFAPPRGPLFPRQALSGLRLALRLHLLVLCPSRRHAVRARLLFNGLLLVTGLARRVIGLQRGRVHRLVGERADAQARDQDGQHWGTSSPLSAA